MKTEHYFPTAMMVLDVGAAIGYGIVGKYWQTVYWLLVFGINYIVAFKLK